MITIKSLQNTFYFLEVEGQFISLKPNEQIIIDETKLNARQLKEIINLTVEDKIELLDYSLNQLEDKLKELSPYYRKAEIDTALESKAAKDHLHSIATSLENGFMSSSDKTKLDTIEANATVNETDDFLRDRATHTGTQLAATVSDFAPSVRSTALEGLSTATAAPVTATDTVLTGVGKLQAQVDLKLDAAAYNDRFLGLFATYFDLVAAHPTASAGDYAQVDWGIGVDVIVYAWDVSDTYWAAIGVSTISTTDDVPEGSSNLYFTSQRVRDTSLTGLSTATATAITAADTVLAAAGKLQGQASANATAIADKLNTADAPAAVRDTPLTGLSTASATPITSTDSVLSAAGKLQAQIAAKLNTTDAPATVRGTALTGLSTAIAAPVTADDTVLTAAGKLQAQATDIEAKLATIQEGATANSNDAALRDRATHTGTQAANTITGLATVATSGSYNDLSDKPTISTDAATLNGQNGVYYLSRANHAGTQAISTVTGLQDALNAKLESVAWGDITGNLTVQTDLQAAFNLKLDAADYNDRFLGLYASVFDLEAAHPTAAAGDYAQVDLGIGTDVIVYVYDVSDAQWMPVGSSSIANTDALPEGSSNLYHTTQRVRDTTLTGLSTATATPVVPTDTVLVAAGKLQAQIAAKLNTSDAPATVRDTALTGLSTATATPVTAADTVLTAAGKLQRQVTDNAALLPPFFETAWYKTGYYYDAVYPYYTTIGPTTGVVGMLYFNKRKILDDVTFNEMSVNVTTAAAGSTVFYGVYASGANGLPTTLLASGSASGDTTGVKSTAVTLALTKGQVVWDAVLATGAAPSLTAFQPIFQDGTGSPTANGFVFITRSGQTSLPADASVGGSFGRSTTSRIIRVALRAA